MAGRALHAYLARLCLPPRRRRLAGESALDSAEVAGSSLIKEAGCTSDWSGLDQLLFLEQSRSCEDFIAVGCQTRRVAQVEVSAMQPLRELVHVAEPSLWPIGLLVASGERTYSGRS